MFKDPVKKAAYMREYEKRNRLRIHANRRRRYWANVEKKRVELRERYWKDPEHSRELKRRSMNRDRDSHLAKRRAYCQRNPEKVLQWHKNNYWSRKRRTPEKLRENQVKYENRVRAEVLAAYGNKCVCCGEGREEFLSIDHINGRGNVERRMFGTNMYVQLRKRGFPKDNYRLLCMNCNFSRGRRGYCPHEREREQEENLRKLWQVAS